MRHLSTLLLLLLLATTAVSQDAPAREDGDYNFDGYSDYRLPAEGPGNQCGWWNYFIFDPAISDYRPVSTSLCREEFDAEQKLVRSLVTGGMAGLIYTMRYFRWDGFELEASSVEAQSYDPDRELFTFTRVTNLDALSGPTVISEILTREEAEKTLR